MADLSCERFGLLSGASFLLAAAPVRSARHPICAAHRLIAWPHGETCHACVHIFITCGVLQGKISREDVSDLCISLLNSKAAANTTFEVTSTIAFSDPWTGCESSGGEWPRGAGAAGRDWERELRQAKLVPGVTGKTIDGVYTGTEPEAEAAAKADREVAAA